MKHEIEAKFLAVDKDAVRAALHGAGFALKAPEYLMRRKTFDFPASEPGHCKWGRVRQEFDRITMTVKETVGSDIHDTFEAEVVVDDFDRAVAIFAACSLPATSYQENRRELWTRGAVEATIDTWPGLKPFVEIEGPDEASVRQAASDLSFDFGQAVFGGVGGVYEREAGIPALGLNKIPVLTFEIPPTRPQKETMS
jgi:adenylate cyclase class 2